MRSPREGGSAGMPALAADFPLAAEQRRHCSWPDAGREAGGTVADIVCAEHWPVFFPVLA